jgi:hypothetical protein
MGANAKIIELRALLAGKFPAPATRLGARLSTGVPPVDELLEGGWPAGRITEVVSSGLSSGSGLLLSAALLSLSRARQNLALIDGADSFDPEPFGQAILRHLLWVRCESAAQSLKAADLLLRDGNLPLVMMDLRRCPAVSLRKIPSSTWYRFQRIAEQGTTAFVVFTLQPLVTSAAIRLRTDAGFSLHSIEETHDQLLSRVRCELVRMQPVAAPRHEEVG